MSNQIFSPEQLTKLVNDTLPKDDDPRGHVLVAGLDQNGVKVVASFKKSKDSAWEFQAAAEHDWSGDNKAGAKVILRW